MRITPTVRIRALCNSHLMRGRYNACRRCLMGSADSTFLKWDFAGRGLAFFLASTSIWCLVADFYGLCPMQRFALYILLPATIALIGLAAYARRQGHMDWW